MIIKKCRFCITKNGGNKYVGGILCGLGGCGKCNGVLTYIEAVRLGRYLRDELEVLKKVGAGVNAEIAQTEADLTAVADWCRENPEKKGI